MLNKYKKRNLYSTFIIFLASLTLVMPQVISGNMIMGSDSIFHFNHFYDTAQQIKHHNFEYFISLYGFQQSGRIITPLYSQVFSYLFGYILLLCGSWYKFQIVSNFLLFLGVGLFFYIFLLKMNVTQSLSLTLSLLYMTTYSISYWVIRQGYSSWGAVFLPLCMIPLIELVRDKKFHSLKIGLSVAITFSFKLISGCNVFHCLYFLLRLNSQ